MCFFFKIIINIFSDNFQDSKEIMITSDSENDYKYSSTPRRFRSTTPTSRTRSSKISTATTRQTLLYTTTETVTSTGIILFFFFH